MNARILTASLAAATFFAGSLAAIAEIAAEPTAEPGVLSSTWTPSRGIASLAGGSAWFGGDWEIGPIAAGIAVTMAAMVVLGVGGLALISFLVGPEPSPPASMAIGAAWGVVVEIVVVLLLIGGLLGDLPAYDSLPHWAWWLATVTWGAALGLLAAAPVRSTETVRT